MDEQKLREQLHRAAETRLSALQGDPWLAQRVMAQAKGEPKVKKKLSAGLIFALILMLMAVAALAATVIGWSDAADFLQLENKQGKFEGWSVSDRISLVRSLVESEAIPKDDNVRMLLSGDLTDAEASALAERIMTDWLSAPVDHVAFRPIMEKIWGEFCEWTLEQKAWFTQTLVEAGIQQPDMEKYVLPDDNRTVQNITG